MSSPARELRQSEAIRGFTQVVGRGRNSLVLHNPATQANKTVTLLGGYEMHFGSAPYTEVQEVDTDWVASGPGWIMNKAEFAASLQGNTYSFSADGESISITITDIPQWVNGANQRQNAASLNAATPMPSGDVMTYNDVIGTGGNLADLTLQATATRLIKRLLVPTLSTFTTPSLTGTVEFSLNFRMTHSAGLTVFVDGASWNEANNSSRTTTSPIEFRNAGGATVFIFHPPWVKDANESTAKGRLQVRKAGGNLFAECRIPYTWMQSAVFPIEIDPTLDRNVSGGSDDGDEVSTTVTLTNTNVAMDSSDDWGAFRFNNVTVDQGATINVAYLKINIGGSGVAFGTTIYGNDEDDAAALGTGASYISSTMPKTTATASWSGTSVSGLDTSSSIVSIVTEITARAGWASGDDMAFMLNRASGSFNMWFYEGGDVAQLHVEWTAAAGRKFQRAAVVGV